MEAAAKKFDQPTHYARKIMLLEELYDTDTFNRFIGYFMEHDAIDITSFKALLRSYNAGELVLPDATTQSLTKGGTYRDDDPELVRDCDYYEQIGNCETRDARSQS